MRRYPGLSKTTCRAWAPPRWGSPCRSAPLAGPWPCSVGRSGHQRYAAQSSVAVGSLRPLCAALRFAPGPLSAARAARRGVPPGLAVRVAGWFGPPARPRWSGASAGVPGGGSPPRPLVPGASVVSSRRSSPPGGGLGALAPPPGGPSRWPLLLLRLLRLPLTRF